MGKQASKHAECFLVNAHLNKALEEEIWKSTKTGFNLANYNMSQSLSELSICLEEKQDNSIPLKVDLPPMKTDNDASKVLAFDQSEECNKEKGEKEQAESRLNIEEFECGVHFGGPETTGSKQEWSFTLYDFDGHGKITREDLASLLKALYDTVGSSIKIPSNGTKTLKLRLTVGQDGSRLPDSLQITQEQEPAVMQVSKKKDNTKNKENMKSTASPKVKVKQFARLNNWTSMSTPPTATTVKCTNETQAKALSASKSRLSTHEQQQLAELVQENMERNHIKQLRRHHSDCRGNQMEHTHHKRRHRTHHGVKDSNKTKDTNNTSTSNNVTTTTTTTTIAAEEAPKESQDRRNYYLDLAGIENNASSSVTALSTSALKPFGLNNTSKHLPINNQPALLSTAGQTCSPGKHKSRSHDTGQKCDNVKQETDRCQKSAAECSAAKPEHLRSKSFDPQDSSVRTPKRNPGNSSSANKHSRFRPVSLPAHVPDTVSPHYHRRHRHREKDHTLAMQQVAEWIEREHRLDLDGDQIVIQRHEHHHVHEHHHHHHYHHYYEA